MGGLIDLRQLWGAGLATLVRGEICKWGQWTPSFGGFSSSPIGTFTYALTGRLCTAFIYMSNPGTSNGTNFWISSPFTATNKYTYQWSAPLSYAQNNSVAVSSCFASIVNNTYIFNLYTAGGGAWTASGSKSALFTIAYEIV